MKLTFTADVTFDQDSWDHLHNGEVPFTEDNLRNYLLSLLLTDQQMTGVLTVNRAH